MNRVICKNWKTCKKKGCVAHKPHNEGNSCRHPDGDCPGCVTLEKMKDQDFLLGATNK